MSLDLSNLNDEQRLAVTLGLNADPAPPLLVIAGAGSGKTTTLAHRVAQLVAEGTDVQRILMLTFSRRAAQEMTHRVEQIFARNAKCSAASHLEWAGTFHAIGARLLREYASQIGLDPNFSIHDREDAADLMDLVRHELGFSEKTSRFPTKATCLAIYSRAVNEELPLAKALEKAFPWCRDWEAELRALFQGYVEAKQRQGALDYDDLLLYWARTMSAPELAESIGSRFDHVLVDEYQDTNRLQATILLGLKPRGTGLTVVGDDAQSIYSFRGAEIRNILDFPTLFSPTAQTVTLDRNYRSTQPILEAANAVIGLAEDRFTKNLWSERRSELKPLLVTVRDELDEAAYLAQQILTNRETGMRLKDQAVLFRAAYHSGPLEVELARRNIPFVKYGGLRFLDSAHIKDILAVLRWSSNPRNRVAGFRVLQLLPGIGPATADRILSSLGDAAPDLSRLTEISPPRAAAGFWSDLADLIWRLVTDSIGWPAEIAALRQWYGPLLEARYEDADARHADLEQLEQIATSYGTRDRLLTELALDPPDGTSAQADSPLLDEDYLVLSTIHSAKGREWKAVFVLKCVDGCIPSDLGAGSSAEVEEERRLLYVAMTRAKDHLALLLPQRFYTHQQPGKGDRHVYASRTRFIPAALLGLFESRAWAPGSTMSPAAGRSSPIVNVSAQMREMWT